MKCLVLFGLFSVRVLCVPLLGSNHDIWSEVEQKQNALGTNTIGRNDSRFPRVLNFFPVPIEEECLSKDGRRRGICMNTYECRIQGGSSHGKCAMGFGVCCVFTVTCNQEVINNLTYFVNPDFPDLTRSMSSCNLTVKKIDEEIAQLRLDFIHFNLGQPNRKTGVCEDDVFMMTGNENRRLKLCGFNSGQHAYFDVEDITNTIEITMILNRKAVSRLWELTITQIPFSQRAPMGCLQYHQGPSGIIQTMNFADNGRHLADQDYNICIRQEEGMCSIAYEPCHEDSFKIAPNNNSSTMNAALADEMEGSGGGEETMQPRQIQEECVDRVILPCDNEDLLMVGQGGPSSCSLVHCGESLCPEDVSPCRIESSSTPFTVGIHFEQNSREAPADDNLGMCLNYEQLPCN
ncbi:uncharacterized protein LOC123316323 [Coccinella septempunctata]|uniref:uncharacterized protein LOC123316323 n=1 Tax=Coccinella septempunctata TaxID=41139 RepID=UPI001D08E02A|nr:uncharacterized protein LOC123316323 [Coccinella septempunctata]